ncbi:hypothetical protein [Shinella oryzae]|uniref:RiboL-PSP-HEPN domain-containing protein n=1 Tax=Shinella oryzae TaxID=2871820 RepID=A0ABY9K6H3_9HYPH|nr:hypothetical protein [Shinella oryzae]WLS04168.1 hypothetical protein Q9315_05995 [Shinella oryzae]
MTQIPKHYAVAFAKRYSDRTTDYFNAATALWRVGELLDDAETLKKYLDIVYPEDNRWAPWVGSEVVSYYAVGLVTCLEWHARSRLVDLLTSIPSAFKTDDLKVMRDKVVVETLTSNVTVAAVVGAATNISTLEDYMGVFARLFDAVGLQKSPLDAVQAKRIGAEEAWLKANDIEAVQNLYRFRNALVHEIGIERLGHFNVRDRWGPDEAIATIQIVHNLMRALECAITSSAPAGFPNLLDSDGVPKSELTRVKQEIDEMEKEVVRIFDDFDDFGDELETSKKEFTRARRSSEIYIRRELDFIDNCPVLFNRYVDMKNPLMLALMQSRRDYLKCILETVGGVFDTDVSIETRSSS